MIKLKNILLEIDAKYVDERKYIHRWMDDNELFILLKNKKVVSKKPFVSFTLDPITIGSAGFSGNLVVFDRRNMEKLNDIIEVWYEPDFFELHPDICLYVTGFKGREDYDNNANYGFSWETYISDYEEEQELVSKKQYIIDENSILIVEVENKNKFDKFKGEYNIID